MKVADIHESNCHILYDASADAKFDPRWFDKQELRQNKQLTGEAPGRGSALFFQGNGNAYVLRHYLRGGLVGKAIKDRYLWTGLSRTRAWAEWRLLLELQQLALPAPKPLAVRVIRHPGSYTADLITHALQDSQTLAESLMSSSLTLAEWREIGRVIRDFHDHDVWHADLNARNILLAPSKPVFLIDFDKSGFRRGHPRWKAGNLARLRRSLDKFKARVPEFNFSTPDWAALTAGYQLS